jgi:type I restriction enzyme, S subunit
MSTITGWTPKKLTELADYINGYAFKPDDWGKEGLPIIRIEQLKNPDAPADYFDGKLPPSKIIEDGDLIFSWSASLFLRIWRHGRAALNQHLFKVIERECVDRAYLKAFIEFYLPALTAASHGSTMQHITRKELERFGAPFPESKPEQTKIADILSTVDRAIEQTEALTAKQQRIKTGLMQDLLTRGIDEHGNLRSEQTHAFKDSHLGRIPVEWEVERLDETTSKIADRDHTTPVYVEDGVLMVSPMAFYNDEDIAFAGCPRITRKAHLLNSRKTDCQPGDIILHRIGAGLGRVRVVAEEQPEFSILHSLALVRPKAQRTDTSFLKWAFRSFELQKQMGLGTQSIGVPDLGLDKIGALLFKIPKSLDEQRKIGTLLDTNQRLLNDQYGSVGKLRSLKAALMQDLLTGKRRVTPLVESEPTREKIYARH